MLTRHGNIPYQPGMQSDKVFSNRYDGEKGGHIEPSYRYESNSRAAFIEVDLPGCSKDDIEVFANSHHLSVSAKRFKNPVFVLEDDEGNGSESAKKDVAVAYSLQIRLGHEADLANITCVSHKDGVLILKVPSTLKEKRRRIEVV